MTLHPGWRRIDGIKQPIFYQFILNGIRVYYYHGKRREIVMGRHKFYRKRLRERADQIHLDLLHKLFGVYAIRVDYYMNLPSMTVHPPDPHIGIDGKNVYVRLGEIFDRSILK